MRLNKKNESYLTKILSIFIAFFYHLGELFSQRGMESDYIPEEYNWNEFKLNDFILTAIICALIVGAGVYLKKKQLKIYKTSGTVLIWVGGICAFAYLGGPILGLVSIILKVGLGIVVFIFILNFFNEKDS